MRGRASFVWAFLAVQAFVLTATESLAADLKLLARPPVPALVGPDTVEPAPVLALSDEHVELDGRAMTSDELGSMLRTLVGNYRYLHPDEPSNGQILVACAPKTSTRRLAEYLRVALAAGFPHPMFLLIQPNPAAKTDRSADQITGALTTMEKDVTATPLKVREHSSCESLVKAVIARRNQKKVVFLDLAAEGGRRSSRSAAQPRVAADGAAPRH
jgi:hypothetical protein